MPKVLQCPHIIRYGCLNHGCMLGYFPANCETCTCPDKRYIEIKTATNTNDL